MTRPIAERAADAWEAAGAERRKVDDASEAERRLLVQNRIRWVLDDAELDVPRVDARPDGTYLATVDLIAFLVVPEAGACPVWLESVDGVRVPLGAFPVRDLADLGRALAAAGYVGKAATS